MAFELLLHLGTPSSVLIYFHASLLLRGLSAVFDSTMKDDWTMTSRYKGIDPATRFGLHLAGATASFIFGLPAVYAILEMVRRGKFEYFAYYCLLVGISGLIYFQFVRS